MVVLTMDSGLIYQLEIEDRQRQHVQISRHDVVTTVVHLPTGSVSLRCS